MPASLRLKTPIAAEVDLPLRVDLKVYLSWIEGLSKDGVAMFNLASVGDARAALAIGLHMKAIAVELAVTLTRAAQIPSKALAELAPCTVRLRVDASLPPQAGMEQLCRELLGSGVAVVLLFPGLPSADTLVSWQRFLERGAVAGVNVCDLECVSCEQYARFLCNVDAWSAMCPVPVISDLVLMPRYVSRSGVVATQCPAGRLAFFVTQEGEIRPCRRSAYPLGRIDTQSLAEVWSGKQAEAWRRVPAECQDCELSACQGGCHARAALGGRDSLCPGPPPPGGAASPPTFTSDGGLERK